MNLAHFSPLRLSDIPMRCSRRLLLFLLSPLALLADPRPTEPLALGPGEVMTFRVGWGIFPSAGEIRIHAEQTPNEPILQVTTTTSTRGFLKNFFPFEARNVAQFDSSTWLLRRTDEVSESKRKNTKLHLDFDYTANTAAYVNALDPGKSAELLMPAGQPMDLITCLVQTRAWDLKPGEQRDALVIFDDDFYELTIHAEGYEEVHTPLGNFRTLVLVPKMEKTEPKGMFKRGSNVKVWISQDERRLPVRFQVEFKFGLGVATLVDHQPPAADVAHAPDPHS
jgi:hypothetical protein